MCRLSFELSFLISRISGPQYLPGAPLGGNPSPQDTERRAALKDFAPLTVIREFNGLAGAEFRCA
jgi:hypothetical protein